jgi:hypothetical protein
VAKAGVALGDGRCPAVLDPAARLLLPASG